MENETFPRKLTAILSADVQGYSRLMGEDEDDTVRTLASCREIMSDLIRYHRGRVVDSPGDNILAEFASVADAVRCAVEIQEALRHRNIELPESRRMEFRIGINLGDVIVERDRIYGDGVNIAARLEGLAEGGGICISGTVFDQVEHKLAFEYDYLGEQAVKNIKRPVRVYRIRTTSDATPPRAEGGPEPPDQPSIAVLPFVNMSGDADQEYFSDGITEELITGLSKVPGLLVIARNSVFTYKGRPVKVQEVSRELGVRYVVEGSVRKSAERVRVTAQLIDAATGRHLWAERYDRDLKDVFALQDEITLKIMKALQVKLTEGEQACEWIKHGTDNYEAYEKSMKGMQHFRRFTPEDNLRARELFEEAIALDPKSPGAYVMLGWTHMTEVMYGASKDPEGSLKQALELSRKSIALDGSQADAYSLLGSIYLFMRRYEEAVAEAERAVALRPNGADHHIWLAMVLTSAGRPEEALGLIKKALRLNPLPPNWYFLVRGDAQRMLGQYDQAIEAYQKALDRSPDFLLVRIGLAACYSASGQREEARAAAGEVLRIAPAFSLEVFGKGLTLKNQADLERYLEALRSAGLT
jgi:adenylate cyclase